MKKKGVLVVDDDPVFRELLCKMLRVRDVETHEAENGFEAVKYFEKRMDLISVIVSDVKMPTMDGIEFLKRVRQTSPVPFILFTGLSDVIESKRAFELGASEFIMKPIDREGIKKIIAVFETAESRAAQAVLDKVPGPEDYRKIQIDDFISATKIQSDIYIRLSEFKFVKVGRKGETTPIDRLQYYRDKKIDFLYVLASEFNAYVGAAADLTHKVVGNNTVPDTSKMKLLQASTKLIAENIFASSDLDKEVMAWTQQILQDTLEFAAQDPAIFQQLVELKNHSDHLYAHSLAVSLYSCIIAKEHGWSSQATLTKISLGGLLHDIGKKEIDPKILQKPRKHMTPEEVKLIESHCDRGRDILLAIPGLPEEVALIALHHHETKMGTGYPRRLKGEQINPLARLVHVVDKFCSFTLPANPDEAGVSTHEAFRKMQLFYGEELDLVFFRGLMKACSFTPEPIPIKKSS